MSVMGCSCPTGFFNANCSGNCSLVTCPENEHCASGHNYTTATCLCNTGMARNDQGICDCVNQLAYGPGCASFCPANWPSLQMVTCQHGLNGSGLLCSDTVLYTAINGLSPPTDGCDCVDMDHTYAVQCTPCNCTTGETCGGGIQGQSCHACPPATYSQFPVVGNNLCTDCEPGRYQPDFAQTSCVACGTGSYSPGSQVGCTTCDTGTYAPTTGLSICIACDAPYYVIGYPDSCTGCLNPDAYGSQCELQCSANCTSQPLPGYCDGGRVDGTGCNCSPSGTTELSSDSHCVCRDFYHGANCSLHCQCDYSREWCSSGTSGTGCVTCPPGTLVGNNSCTQCSPGRYQQGSMTSCDACGIGHYRSGYGGTTCHACAAGRYANTTGSTSCTSCATDVSYQPSTGSSTCLSCLPPLRAQTTTTCAACSDPTAFSTSCQLYCNGTSCTDAPSFGVCDVGYRASTGCMNCPGHATTLTDPQGPCSCQPEWFGALCDQSCDTQCYSTNKACADGKLGSCSTCPSGYIAVQAANQGCQACGVGTYHNQTTDTQCTACSPGSYQPSQNATSCIQCAAGRFQTSSSATSCTACQTGRYQPSLGATSCLLCSPGYAQPGQNATSCAACAVGRYQASSASTACTACATGRYQSQQNATVCPPCPTGLYQPSTAASVCLSCPAGVSSSDHLVCDTCDDPQAYRSSQQGTSCDQTCDDCAEGAFCYPGYTGQGCLPCAAGSVDLDGICTLCTQGYYQHGSEQVCSACFPRGYSTNSTGSTSCIQCASGLNSTEGVSCDVCSDPLAYGEGCRGDCRNCTAGIGLCDHGLESSTGCMAPPAWQPPGQISIQNDSARLTQVLIALDIDIGGITNLALFSSVFQAELITITGAAFTPVVNSITVGSLLVNVTLGFTAAQILQQFSAAFNAGTVSLDPQKFPVFTHFTGLFAPGITLSLHFVPQELSYDTTCGGNSSSSICRSIHDATHDTASPYYPATCYAGLCGCTIADDQGRCDTRTMSTWVDPEQMVCVGGASLGLGDVCTHLLTTLDHIEYYVTRRVLVNDSWVQNTTATLPGQTQPPLQNGTLTNATVFPWLPTGPTAPVDDGLGDDECQRRHPDYVNWQPQRRYCQNKNAVYGQDRVNIQLVVGDPYTNSTNSTLLVYLFQTAQSNADLLNPSQLPVVMRGYLSSLYQGAQPLATKVWVEIEYSYLYQIDPVPVIQADRLTILDSGKEMQFDRVWKGGREVFVNCTLLGVLGDTTLAYPLYNVTSNTTTCACNVWNEFDPSSATCVPGCRDGFYGARCNTTGGTCPYTWDAASQLFWNLADCTPVCRTGYTQTATNGVACTLIPPPLLLLDSPASDSVAGLPAWFTKLRAGLVFGVGGGALLLVGIVGLMVKGPALSAWLTKLRAPGEQTRHLIDRSSKLDSIVPSNVQGRAGRVRTVSRSRSGSRSHSRSRV